MKKSQEIAFRTVLDNFRDALHDMEIFENFLRERLDFTQGEDAVLAVDFDEIRTKSEKVLADILELLTEEEDVL